MAGDAKISQLPQITTPQSTDLIPIVDAGQTQSITFANLLAAISGSATSGTFAALKAKAALNPDALFIAFATDIGDGQVVMYVGDITKGSEGFVGLGGA